VIPAVATATPPTGAVPTATPQNIQQILSSGTPAEQIAALQAMMANATPPVDAATQNAYAQALQQLAGQAGQMDPATQDQLQMLLTGSAASPLLSGNQQQFVLEQLSPAIAPTPSPETITLALGQQTPEQRIAGLQNLLIGSQGKTIDPSTQNAFGQGLQNIIADLNSLSPAAQAQVNDLFNLSIDSSLLSPAQKQYVQSNMLPQIGSALLGQLGGLEGLLGQSAGKTAPPALYW